MGNACHLPRDLCLLSSGFKLKLVQADGAKAQLSHKRLVQNVTTSGSLYELDFIETDFHYHLATSHRPPTSLRVRRGRGAETPSHSHAPTRRTAVHEEYNTLPKLVHLV